MFPLTPLSWHGFVMQWAQSDHVEISKFSFCLFSALARETTCSCLDPEPENYIGRLDCKTG